MTKIRVVEEMRVPHIPHDEIKLPNVKCSLPVYGIGVLGFEGLYHIANGSRGHPLANKSPLLPPVRPRREDKQDECRGWPLSFSYTMGHERKWNVRNMLDQEDLVVLRCGRIKSKVHVMAAHLSIGAIHILQARREHGRGRRYGRPLPRCGV
jgi:hypothetical protein